MCAQENLQYFPRFRYLYSIYEDLIIFRIICTEKESRKLRKNKKYILKKIEEKYKIKIIQVKKEKK